MTPRIEALQIAGHRSPTSANGFLPQSSAEMFGSHVFGPRVMKKMLPPMIYNNIVRAMAGEEKIKPEYADPIAVAMKDWAVAQGATHYTHWFQPLTGASAEKHDSLFDWSSPDDVIESFCGSQLLQGEPDASSFPSGGLRSTYEARGYTGWDPSSPAFIWTAGDGVTLFIPSVFFSWTGDILDSKIPLLRSDHVIQEAALRLLRLTGTRANRVFSTVGMEQEYFVIDRALRNLRPDLMLAGRTVYGAPSPKGQELQDHYFGSVKDRILRFMRDFEEEAIRLGIPIKTRHNEVAPAQHEIAPVFEKASLAVDHNIVIMEVMRQVAGKHDLTCLLHEKPFAGLNGSGKHTNWALSTDKGLNLLSPSVESPDESLRFLILLTAILNAVHRHAALLRASIGSAGNDHRLGGHEAPPAIMSVYLGDELERLLDTVETKGTTTSSRRKGKYDLGIPVIPELPRDNTDRNRTSPFAFTGNKFEFRAVGSSASAALPVTVLNVIVAESLNEMLNKIEAALPKKPKDAVPTQELAKVAMPVIREYLVRSKPVRFSGDNYCLTWTKEALRRELPNIQKSIDAYSALKTKTTVKAFSGVLSKAELGSRYEVLSDNCIQSLNIEINLMIDMFRSLVLPAAIRYQDLCARSIGACASVGADVGKPQKKALSKLTATIDRAIVLCDELEATRQKASLLTGTKKHTAYSEEVWSKAAALRTSVDTLETLVDDCLWPLPKYRELLFMV